MIYGTIVKAENIAEDYRINDCRTERSYWKSDKIYRRREKMLTPEKLEKLILKYDIAYNHDILPGHTKEKIRWVLPEGIANAMAFEKAESFFIGFFEDGVYVFPVINDWEADDPTVFEWESIRSFEVKKGVFMENELHLITDQMMLELKIPKRMANNPWVKENAIFLNSINYNCK